MGIGREYYYNLWLLLYVYRCEEEWRIVLLEFIVDLLVMDYRDVMGQGSRLDTDTNNVLVTFLAFFL